MTLVLIQEVAAIVKPPRAAFVPFPMGSPVGEPGNVQKQMDVLYEVLQLLVTLEEPGTRVQLPFTWRD